MRMTLIAAVFLSFAADQTIAATADYSKSTVEELINELAQIDHVAPGLHDTADFEMFIADDEAPRFSSGIVGSVAPVVPPQMRELVRRGSSALPALIAHLGDARPTKLIVRGMGVDATFGGVFFEDEYHARNREFHGDFSMDRAVTESYTVKIGDVCFALIGQIVNRRLLAIRYQPTAITIINSPIETPDLADQVRKDWGSIDAEGLNASLLADLRSNKEYYVSDSALPRLRLYYPDTYASLAGADAKKRDAFEREERERRNDRR